MYVYVLFLLICGLPAVQMLDSAKPTTHYGNNTKGEEIVRSVVSLTSSSEYKLAKWKKLKFYIDTSEFPDPERVLNARLYLYQEPGRRKQQWPKQAEVVLLRKHRARDTIVAIGQVSTATVGWLDFDVTSSVRQWIREPGTNRGLDVWLQMFHYRGQQKRAVTFHGPSKQHSSTAPTLVIRYDLRNTQQSGSGSHS